MSEKITFSYFYGQEADMLSFYRIPKLLFTNDYFRELPTEAKVLYGLMLDRMSLSIKNKWFDVEKRAYIYFSVEDTMEMLNCKKNKPELFTAVYVCIKSAAVAVTTTLNTSPCQKTAYKWADFSRDRFNCLLWLSRFVKSCHSNCGCRLWIFSSVS